MTAEGVSSGGSAKRYEYPACSNASSLPAWDGWAEADEEAAAEPLPKGAARAEGRLGGADIEARMAEETRRSFEAGRERGREEGRRAEREALVSAAQAEADRRRRQAAELIENFTRERDRYLHAVEQEVVRLALAVAARILRREAQMDPLLLTGAVRVALGQLAATSEIRLRVPAREIDLWKETIALLPNLTVKPLVVADDGMLLGDCAIESKVGTVDLGIRAQLGEIERGFFDRAGAPDAPAGQHDGSAAQESSSHGVRA
jgi:flagellar biosynthesis/type III secretory pathway protein FliH